MQRTTTLVIAGHDPSGGAGIQADIEAIAALGGHAATLVTALTCQDTHNVHDVQVVDSAFFDACLARLEADIDFAAIKTGVLASPAQARAVAALAERHPECPLIIDPVLVASGGGRLADDSVGQVLRDEVIRHAHLITPNAREARALCDGEPDLAVCGRRLAEQAALVLITGGDETADAPVINRLFDADGEIAAFEWPRLPGPFHGSGCSLAATIAGLLAAGTTPREAVAEAQTRVHAMLASAFTISTGQAIPDRFARP